MNQLERERLIDDARMRLPRRDIARSNLRSRAFKRAAILSLALAILAAAWAVTIYL
ncbi:hypothetical protein FDH38_gp112 [Dinoroseobacter phage vB_DshS-R5C]|uniref:Uncharacterized protein n=1 Tax=Dinoroseobacter phage vB_DshS-R5C TaxID=1965368 RepID=A0A1V0DYC3_9CAUD|nr:hypothetical protein FDH38_gp112 [Dinoroseobacter phage vB_DshS-R5C]ARB06166.1 hypothetical protein vBDshSR5C_112 [Dinoroseobacter phage vB_DshS-R5C]